MSVDDLYKVIERESVYGYRLTDNIYGLPYIEKKDIQTDGEGRFVIRFRLPMEKHELAFELVADRVCKEIGYKKEVYHEIRFEYGLPYMECAWILSERLPKEEGDCKTDFLLTCKEKVKRDI